MEVSRCLRDIWVDTDSAIELDNSIFTQQTQHLHRQRRITGRQDPGKRPCNGLSMTRSNDTLDDSFTAFSECLDFDRDARVGSDNEIEQLVSCLYSNGLGHVTSVKEFHDELLSLCGCDVSRYIMQDAHPFSLK